MSVTHRVDSIRDKRLLAQGITPPGDWNDIDQVRAVKKQEIGAACTAAIYAGIEIGGKRYSLENHDQTELMAQLAFVEKGAAAVPYHANGELCRAYSAEEFTSLAAAAMAHIFYHRTYCNHMNEWIRTAAEAELEDIVYGAALPPDLAENMAAILAAAGGAA